MNVFGFQLNSKALGAIGGAGLLVASFVGAATTTAVFTDSVGVAGNAFTTGSVDIGASPASAALTFSNMMPGDQVTAPITVSNNASAQLRYAMTTATTNVDGKNLATQLTLEVRAADGGGGCAAFTGAVIRAAGPLSTAAIGSPVSGAQAGDRVLNAAASEALCFRVTLPLSTGNAFQGAATTATFTFDAEQTANN